ncbi:NAD(P)-binding domain-containing protein [Jatrophihabitans fulvus]
MSSDYDVAVIGCGPMGSAIATTFAARGLRVAAWNRSPEKAEALAGENLTAVADVRDAVRSVPLVVACTATYDTTKDALTPVTDWAGTTLVNVGTGVPTQVESFRTWAADRGAAYLDGAILCYPQHIGTDEGMIIYSGSAEAWAEHEKALVLLGSPSTIVAEDPSGASVLDVALTGAFYVSALSAYVEAATYALEQGIDPATLKAMTEVSLGALAMTTAEAVDAIAADAHETDSATLGVYAEGSRATLDALRTAGHHGRVLAAAVDNLSAGERAGLGPLGFSALTRVARTS